MPSSLKTFEEFDRLLAAARAEVDAMFIAEPGFMVVEETPERYFMEHSP